MLMSDNLANKIAAGEVVEKCASVVKELVENSIDAGSSEIKIELEQSGVKSIKVTDNGCGMDNEDAVMCFYSHATSKIKNEDDLYNINTLGFRGEALPSIASVSNITIKTCDGENSVIYELEAGKIKDKKSGDLRKGTSIEVKDLFYNTPARLKYLNSLYTELANITECVNKAALSNTNIRFTLINDGKTLLKTDGSGNLLKTINDIYGVKIAKKMLKISGENDDYQIDGYISLPEITKSNRNSIITIVNKRVVRNQELNRCINEAYHTYKPDNRYPIIVLTIDVDSSLIDVNVHPSKMDIKFSNFDELKKLVFDKIRSTLDKTLLVPDIDNSSLNVSNIVNEIKIDESNDNEKKEEITFDFQDTDVVDNFVKEEDEKYNKEEKIILPKMYPIGAVLGTYIICQNENGMYIIDQHAANERINYEKYKKAMGNPKNDKISMLFPINIEYPTNEFIIIKENLDFIKSLNIDIEEFGVNSFIIKAHPTWFKEGYEEEFIRNILEKIVTMEKNFNVERFNDSVSATMACKASIKGNEAVSIEEMEHLINELAKTDNPYTCPHGRPTVIHYPVYELEKLFKRAM